MSNTRDHPVFKRLSRQQLIVRRRSLGLQPLVLDPTFASSRKTRCKHCGRRFNPVWKSYLCHLCGRWVCEPCSSVVERERELLLVRFVRCCVTCTKMLNKLPEPELLLPFLAVPYVTASSNSQLGLHLADVLRTKKDLRPTVLQLLSYLGRPLGTNAQILAEIREEEWAAATELVSSSVTLDAPIRTKSGKQRRQKRRNGDSSAKPGNPEWVQFLVQQCFEVSLTELPLDECVVSESDGTRQYPIFYDEETDVPFAPTVPDEAARDDCMAKCNLLTRGVAAQKEVQLICHLAAKEFDALLATVTAVQADKHYALSVVNSESTCVSTDRAKSFCAHSMVSGLPFLVRNTLLDVRFRTFACIRGDTEGIGTRVLFYFGFPIRAAHSDTVIAMLCVMDTKPRKSITTMQYSVMKKLTEILSSLWTE